MSNAKECWRCEQKAQWKNELLNAAREQAKKESVEAGETMAIIQTSGCIYLIVKASEIINQTVIEYINATD